MNKLVDGISAAYNGLLALPRPNRAVFLGIAGGVAVGGMAIYDIGGVRSLFKTDIAYNESVDSNWPFWILIGLVVLSLKNFERFEFLSSMLRGANFVILTYMAVVWWKTHVGV